MTNLKQDRLMTTLRKSCRDERDTLKETAGLTVVVLVLTNLLMGYGVISGLELAHIHIAGITKIAAYLLVNTLAIFFIYTMLWRGAYMESWQARHEAIVACDSFSRKHRNDPK